MTETRYQLRLHYVVLYYGAYSSSSISALHSTVSYLFCFFYVKKLSWTLFFKITQLIFFFYSKILILHRFSISNYLHYTYKELTLLNLFLPCYFIFERMSQSLTTRLKRFPSPILRTSLSWWIVMEPINLKMMYQMVMILPWLVFLHSFISDLFEELLGPHGLRPLDKCSWNFCAGVFIQIDHMTQVRLTLF